MNTLREEKRRLIKELLLKYTDPKPEFDGITAWDIAGRILALVERTCMICGQADQPESLLEKTVWGWAHQECLEMQEREANGSQSEKAYERQEQDSHLHP